MGETLNNFFLKLKFEPDQINSSLLESNQTTNWICRHGRRHNEECCPSRNTCHMQNSDKEFANWVPALNHHRSKPTPYSSIQHYNQMRTVRSSPPPYIGLSYPFEEIAGKIIAKLSDVLLLTRSEFERLQHDLWFNYLRNYSILKMARDTRRLPLLINPAILTPLEVLIDNPLDLDNMIQTEQQISFKSSLPTISREAEDITEEQHDAKLSKADDVEEKASPMTLLTEADTKIKPSVETNTTTKGSSSLVMAKTTSLSIKPDAKKITEYTKRPIVKTKQPSIVITGKEPSIKIEKLPTLPLVSVETNEEQRVLQKPPLYPKKKLPVSKQSPLPGLKEDATNEKEATQFSKGESLSILAKVAKPKTLMPTTHKLLEAEEQVTDKDADKLFVTAKPIALGGNDQLGGATPIQIKRSLDIVAPSSVILDDEPSPQMPIPIQEAFAASKVETEKAALNREAKEPTSNKNGEQKLQPSIHATEKAFLKPKELTTEPEVMENFLVDSAASTSVIEGKQILSAASKFTQKKSFVTHLAKKEAVEKEAEKLVVNVKGPPPRYEDADVNQKVRVTEKPPSTKSSLKISVGDLEPKENSKAAAASLQRKTKVIDHGQPLADLPKLDRSVEIEDKKMFEEKAEKTSAIAEEPESQTRHGDLKAMEVSFKPEAKKPLSAIKVNQKAPLLGLKPKHIPEDSAAMRFLVEMVAPVKGRENSVAVPTSSHMSLPKNQAEKETIEKEAVFVAKKGQPGTKSTEKASLLSLKPKQIVSESEAMDSFIESIAPTHSDKGQNFPVASSKSTEKQLVKNQVETKAIKIKIEQAPALKVEQPLALKVEQPPALKVEQPPALKVEQPLALKVEGFELENEDADIKLKSIKKPSIKSIVKTPVAELRPKDNLLENLAAPPTSDIKAKPKAIDHEKASAAMPKLPRKLSVELQNKKMLGEKEAAKTSPKNEEPSFKIAAKKFPPPIDPNKKISLLALKPQETMTDSEGKESLRETAALTSIKKDTLSSVATLESTHRPFVKNQIEKVAVEKAAAKPLVAPDDDNAADVKLEESVPIHLTREPSIKAVLKTSVTDLKPTESSIKKSAGVPTFQIKATSTARDHGLPPSDTIKLVRKLSVERQMPKEEAEISSLKSEESALQKRAYLEVKKPFSNIVAKKFPSAVELNEKASLLALKPSEITYKSEPTKSIVETVAPIYTGESNQIPVGTKSNQKPLVKHQVEKEVAVKEIKEPDVEAKVHAPEVEDVVVQQKETVFLNLTKKPSLSLKKPLAPNLSFKESTTQSRPINASLDTGMPQLDVANKSATLTVGRLSEEKIADRELLDKKDFAPPKQHVDTEAQELAKRVTTQSSLHVDSIEKAPSINLKPKEPTTNLKLEPSRLPTVENEIETKQELDNHIAKRPLLAPKIFIGGAAATIMPKPHSAQPPIEKALSSVSPLKKTIGAKSILETIAKGSFPLPTAKKGSTSIIEKVSAKVMPTKCVVTSKADDSSSKTNSIDQYANDGINGPQVDTPRVSTPTETT